MRSSTITSLTAASLVSLLALGCTKDSSKKENPVAPPDDLGIEVPSTDEVWALAPADTKVAVVIGEGTGEFLLAAIEEFQGTMDNHPVGARLLVKMMDEMDEDIPRNVLERSYHKEIGLDLSRPAALFMNAREEPVVVLPVSDRAAFRKLVGGTLDEAANADVIDEMRCKELSGSYVCARSDEVLATVGKGADMARTISGLDKDLRGHVEFYVAGEIMREKSDNDMEEVMGEVQAFHASVQLERGGFHARAHVKTSPRHPAIAAAARVPSDIAKRIADENPSGFARLRVPIRELIPADAMSEIGPGLAMAKLDAKADIVDNLTGELVLYSLAQKGLGVVAELGLEDGKRLNPAVDFLCDMGKLQLPGEAKEMVEISGGKGTCKVSLDMDKLGALAPPNMPDIGIVEAELYTTSGSLAVRLNVETKHKSGPVEASAPGRDLMLGSWNLAIWGYGSFTGMFDASFMDTLGELPGMESEDHENMLFGLWLLGHLTEMGLGVGVRDDGAHMAFRMGTQWANPEPVLRDYQKLLTQAVSGDASAHERLDALAAKSPDTPFGRAHRAGAGGGPMITAALIGVASAVAVPAFLRYSKAADEAEARAYEAEVQALEAENEDLENELEAFEKELERAKGLAAEAEK